MSVSWIVLKFGGTSVTGLEQWKKIRQIMNRHLSTQQPILVVCSAISQVSNHLENLAKAAQKGEDVTPYYQKIYEIHHHQATQLGVELDCIQEFLDDLKQLAF